MNRIRAFLRSRFPVEEINGAGRCATYLYRYHLISTRWFKVYLHEFVASDWSRDLHDHPKRFISIGLKGRYTEVTPAGTRGYVAPWIRTFPAEHTHRLLIEPGHTCWTLIIVGRPKREWGFWTSDPCVPKRFWVPWYEYVKSDAADREKDCG